MNIRKIIKGSLILTVLGAQLIGCGAKTVHKGKELNKPEVINIAVQAIPNDELVAKAKGWYESELGVKVNFKQFDSGRDINTAFASKSVDIAVIGTTPVSLGIATGIPYEVFWIHDVIGEAESLVVKNFSGINSVKDLKGKKIAVPFGSTAHYSLLNALILEEVKESDVQILDMQPQDIYTAWQRGDIDGAYVWNPTLGELLKEGNKIIDSKQLAEKGIVTADLGVVSKEFAEKYPDIVKEYVKLQIKAKELYDSKPDEAGEAIAKELNISKEDALVQTGQLMWISAEEQISEKYLGNESKKGDLSKTLKNTADFLVSQKSINSTAEESEFKNSINTKFIEEALK